MAYDFTVPNQYNLVRTTSGDLAKMRENFVVLAPVALSGLTGLLTHPGHPVSGDFTVTGQLAIGGGADVAGQVALGSNLTVTGNLLVTGQVAVASEVGIGGASPGGGIALNVKGNFLQLRNYADSTTTLRVDAGSTTTQTAQVDFRDRGNSIFAFRKSSSNDLLFFDAVNSANVLVLTSGTVVRTNAIRLNADGSVCINGSTTTKRFNVEGDAYIASGCDMGGGKVTSVGTPTASGDGANKGYVDGTSGKLSRCVLRLSGDQTYSDAVAATVQFDENPINDGGWGVDLVSGIITVPAGVTHVECEAQLHWAPNVTSYRRADLQVDGADVPDAAVGVEEWRCGVNTGQRHQLRSYLFAVSQGQEITVLALQDGGGNLDLLGHVTSGNNTWLAVRGYNFS